HDGHRCRRRGCAVGTKRTWRVQGNLCLVPFRNRRPRRRNHHGGNDLPGRAHLLAFDAPNLLMTAYPLVMVPTFAVPLALMSHGLGLWRLRRETAPGRLVTA